MIGKRWVGAIGVMRARMKTFNALLVPMLSALVLFATEPQSQAQDASLLMQGEAVFKHNCAGCHAVGPNARNGIGPILNGLFGRHAGALESYKYYSKAFKNSDIIWSQESFAAYIENPREMVVNNKQVFDGLKDKNEIAALTAYLAQF